MAVAILAVIWLTAGTSAHAQSPREGDERLRHFESKIRPTLIQHCQECHAVDTEKSGGLLLDSAAGWQQGGDSGPTIVAGKPDESLLIKAIGYGDAKLQMPPNGKLPDEVIADLRLWVEQGALDPRFSQTPAAGKKSLALSVEEAEKHWAYRPLPPASSDLPQTANSAVQFTPEIDQLIDRQLKDSGIETASSADSEDLIRRLFFDLTGLPPTVEQWEYWRADFDEQRYQELVEHLLASPNYGEKFARHWMDVVRYADSITLRGFVHTNAWRYRDYLIDAYNQDRPFQQLIREQIAGDLLPASDNAARSRQLVATAFLALGNTNLEKQDKAQLDMDYLDEQLDVIGAAFLAQTIGCARCHDHKFDPIPTKDYYALAGILKSTTGMKHANVSEWIEQPLPQDNSQQEVFEQAESKHKLLTKNVQNLKKKLESIANKNPRFIQPSELPGVVVDSAQATLVGKWVSSSSVGNIVGDTYLHDDNAEKGFKSATFEPDSLVPGEYEVLLAYQHADNRATNVAVKVFSAGGEAEITINQQKPAPELGIWFSLGRFRFEANGQKYVLVSNANTDGYVVLDAVLFLPISQVKDGSLASTLRPDPSSESTKNDAKVKQELKQLEAEVAALQKTLDARPKYLTVLENGSAQDIAIHVRGDVHTLGDIVPRGFLTALQVRMESTDQPDRLQLANWIGSSSNPLTARVYANRIWTWLMGKGIVSTPNNFGTTGVEPTHPELLDRLAQRLINSDWSTKTLVRDIVLSQAYRRAIVEPSPIAVGKDPDNRLLWRGHLRRLTAESLRDSMLVVSGELDSTRGGSTIRPGTKVDYNYLHESNRRSIYQPVFRNSLPDLFDEFDFANPSMSIDVRSRSTVAPQGLALMQDPWVTARAKQTALLYASIIRSKGISAGLEQLYVACLSRRPTQEELLLGSNFLKSDKQQAGADSLETKDEQVDLVRLEQLIQALFASVDFRFLD